MNKNILCSITGVVGSLISWCFGGWDTALQTLVLFMIFDYVTGLVVAGIFKASPKTETGALQSTACFRGLCKKLMILVYVVIGYRIDVVLNLDYIRNCVIIGFMASELISITENAGLMGVPLPTIIVNAIDMLKKKGDCTNDESIN